ncbi:MAG: class I SAM-dependent methyltransferase [Planctomycetaceae bacterium]|nr:class I SAM-dependent methyltransferase [Planctomycetaceae bacterium]
MVRVPRCPACGSRLRARFETDCGGRRMSVSQCDGCGSYVKDPFFDADEIGEVYRHYGAHEQHYDPPPGEIDAMVAKIRRIEREAAVGGDLLEVGCGRGYFLTQARRRGWKTHGLEIEGSARTHLLPEVADAVTFISSERDFSKIEPARYDVICSYQVFEHLLQPKETLAHWIRGLKPGGILILDTPNAASLGARMRQAAWVHHTRPEHFVLFTAGALRRLCRDNGMQVLRTHYGGTPAVCSGTGGVSTTARKIFRFRSLSRFARTLIHRFGLGDNVEVIARKR